MGWIVGLVVPCSIWILQVLHSVAPAWMVGIAQPRDQSPAGAQAAAVVLVLQPERAGHARAALLDVMHAQPGDQPQQVLAGRADLSACRWQGMW